MFVSRHDGEASVADQRGEQRGPPPSIPTAALHHRPGETEGTHLRGHPLPRDLLPEGKDTLWSGQGIWGDF